MPLPTDSKTPWPPPWWDKQANEIELAATWYEGDPKQLAAVYGAVDAAGNRVRPSDAARRSFTTRVREFFWGRETTTTESLRMHVPAAADIAGVSADLLFGEEPTLRIPGAHTARPEGPNGEPGPPTPEQAEAIATEERLSELVELDGIASTLLDAAEFASGLGAVYLRPTWDKSVADHPMLTIVNADHAVPEFRYGRLVAVTFWTVVWRNHSTEVWRHLERYEPGVVYHGLYRGTDRQLGTQIPLAEHPSTAALVGSEGVGKDGVLALPQPLKDQLGVQMIPNATHRGREPQGRSDTAGTETEMSALDEAWSSWMRDIRLGKARVVIPNEFLDRSGRGTGATFDVDREIFSPLDMDPATREKAGIELIQPQIRAEDHARTCSELYSLIIRAAGYNPQSFGLEGDGGQATATEWTARERRSLHTNSRKQRRVQRAVGVAGWQLLVIDSVIFGSGLTPMRPEVVFVDPTEADIRERASTLNLINLAQAASVEERVRILHPEWDEPAIAAEATRIRSDYGLAVENPTGVP